jgi:rRNA biogenesis protein RRP5
MTALELRGFHSRSVCRVNAAKHQRLVEGALVLGQVSQINPQDIAVALPNNLIGYVSLTRISGPLTKAVDAIVQEEEDDINLPSMEELFIVGQWVRTVVVENTAITGSTDQSRKKHIELSLEPESVNASIHRSDIIPKTLLQVSVTSIEDHGIIVSLGLPDLTGFIKKTSLGVYNVEDIIEGRVFLACVESKPKNKVVQLSLNLKPSQIPIEDVSDINSLLPGSTVRCLVSEVRAAGAGGKIMGMLNATIDKLHIGGATISENENVLLFSIRR